MATPTDPEPFVAHFGERYRQLIIDSLQFLDDRELSWELDKPIDRWEYIGEIIKNAKIPTE
jgi:hypothetical protein